MNGWVGKVPKRWLPVGTNDTDEGWGVERKGGVWNDDDAVNGWQAHSDLHSVVIVVMIVDPSWSFGWW